MDPSKSTSAVLAAAVASSQSGGKENPSGSEKRVEKTTDWPKRSPRKRARQLPFRTSGTDSRKGVRERGEITSLNEVKPSRVTSRAEPKPLPFE